jgi:hypothetical protein
MRKGQGTTISSIIYWQTPSTATHRITSHFSICITHTVDCNKMMCVFVRNVLHVVICKDFSSSCAAAVAVVEEMKIFTALLSHYKFHASRKGKREEKYVWYVSVRGWSVSVVAFKGAQ